MTILSDLIDGFRGPRADVDPANERYWSSGYVGAVLSNTGIAVTSETALQVSCVFHGVRLRAETVGRLPLILYRERNDGGKDRAKDHPLWPVLRRRPNAWQTAQQFRETLTAQMILWGGGFAEILPGPRGAVDQLIPLDPNLTIEQLDNRDCASGCTRRASNGSWCKTRCSGSRASPSTP